MKNIIAEFEAWRDAQLERLNAHKMKVGDRVRLLHSFDSDKSYIYTIEEIDDTYVVVYSRDARRRATCPFANLVLVTDFVGGVTPKCNCLQPYEHAKWCNAAP